MNSLDHILKYLKKGRRRFRLLLVWKWVLRSIWVFFALSLLGLVAANAFSTHLLPGIYKCLLLGLCVFGFVQEVARPWFRARSFSFVTDLLRRKDSRLASAALASVELNDSGRVDSDELVKAHHEQVRQSIRTQDWKDILPSKRLKKHSLFSIVGMVLVLALVKKAPPWLTESWNALRFGPKPEPRLAVVPNTQTPTFSLFRDLQLTLEPPAYTGLPKRLIESSTGEVTVLPGTHLTLIGHTKESSSSVRLESWKVNEEAQSQTTDVATTLDAQSKSQFEASWQVMRETKYRLSAQLKDLSWSADEKIRTISIEEDLPPKVDVQFPKDELTVQKDTDIEIAYWIKDDYGIESVTLEVQDGDSTTSFDFFKANDTPKLSLEETKEWTFNPEGFSTGVPLPVTIAVKDNDTVNGPKITRSKTFYITIESLIDKESNAIQSIKVLAETLIQSLAYRLPLEASRFSASQSDINLSSQVSAHFQQAIVDVSRVKKNNREWLIELRRMSKTHETWLAKERDQTPTPATNANWLVHIEKDVLRLVDWLKRKQIEHIRTRQKEIEAQQNRIAELMKKHAENPTPESEANLMRALEKLEKQMADLAKEQAQLPSDVIDEFVNKDAGQQNESGESCLDQVKSLLAQGDTNGAMAQMTKCKEEMEKQAKQMERSLDSLKSSDSLEQGKAQAQWMNKLNSIMDKQEKISEQTQGEEKSEQQGEQRGEKPSENGEQGEASNTPSPLNDSEQRQRLLEAQKRLAEATKELGRDPNTKDSSTLKEAAQAMKNAEESLKQQDGQSAKAHMESALEKLNKVAKDAQDSNSNGQESENREKIELPDKDDHKIPKELREDILEAMKRGNPPPEYKLLLKKYYEAITQ